MLQLQARFHSYRRATYGLVKSGEPEGKERVNHHYREVSQMQNDQPNDGVTAKPGEYPSPDEILHHELGEELYKKTVPLLNDILGKLLTVSITLSGGSIFFLSDKGYPNELKVAAVIMFLLAFVTALGAVLPHSVSLRYCCPEEVKEAIEKASWWKRLFITMTAGFIIVGVGCAVAGFFFITPPATH